MIMLLFFNIFSNKAQLNKIYPKDIMWIMGVERVGVHKHIYYDTAVQRPAVVLD